MTAHPTIKPRSAWTNTKSNAVPAKSADMHGVAVHHPGDPGTLAKESDKQTAARLEGYRRQHVNVNGWKDIAYNVAVDQRGQLWTLRGISRQCGANGTSTANRQNGAILVLVGNGEAPTDACIRGIQYAIRLYDVRFPGKIKSVRPHSYFIGTGCPGSELRRLLNDGKTLYMSGARRQWPNVKA